MSNTLYEILKAIVKKQAAFCEFDDFNRRITYGHTKSLVFDFHSQSIHSGKYYIMRQGQLMRSTIFLSDGSCYNVDPNLLIDQEERPYEIIEKLYSEYYNSIPSMEESYASSYFKAISSKKITLEQMNKGIARTEARYALEGYILLSVVCGNLKWKNHEHFYWFSRKQKGLILFRSWIEREKKEGKNGKIDTRRDYQFDG